MRRLIIGRLLQAVVVTLLVTTLTFVLIHLAPGDPWSREMASAHITPQARAVLDSTYGLDRPVAVQYLLYLRNVARGDFGVSFAQGIPVVELIGGALPRTLLLMGTALLVGFALGVVVGVVQGRWRGSALDRRLSTLSLLFYSIPDFWLAILVLLVFAYWLPLFPAGGDATPVVHALLPRFGRFLDTLRHLVLPAATLSLLLAAGVARYQRAAVLGVLDEGFVRTARAKGVSETRLIAHHVLRNALFPVITLVGLSFPLLLGGTVFVERVFSWPGMGSLAVNALAGRDYPLVVATAIVGSFVTVLGGLVADLLYCAADPRVRLG